METIIIDNSFDISYNVFSLPMRDGNISIGIIPGFKFPVFSLPMRDGNMDHIV